MLTLPQSYDEIKVAEVPEPRPKDDEVLVKIAVCGVNYVDLLYVSFYTAHILVIFLLLLLVEQFLAQVHL